MSHYFTNDKIKSEEKIIKAKINNNEFSYIVDNGVFSKKGLDYGTRSLLENIDIKQIKGNVLDFGCGYGPIGIYIAKTTKANVDMVDINERSLKLTKKNIKLNQVSANVFKSDIYENVTKKYDYIITNPPIRVGKTILYKILFEAKKHLTKNGIMCLVVNKNQGAKKLMNDLAKEYKVTLLKKNKGFYIIKCENILTI